MALPLAGDARAKTFDHLQNSLHSGDSIMSEIERTEIANAAITTSKFGVGRLKPGTVQVTVGSKVTAKSLHDIMDLTIKMHGCLACGLGGLDVIIRSQDPRISEAFQQISDVKDVSIIS
jgi:exosome complex RNA-binding protein Rrp4